MVSRIDQNKLKHVGVDLLGIPASEWVNNTHPLKKAFQTAGIEGFGSDFLTMSEEDFARLTYPDVDYDNNESV